MRTNDAIRPSPRPVIAQVNAALPWSGVEGVAEQADHDEGGELGRERQGDAARAPSQAGGERRHGERPEHGRGRGGGQSDDEPEDSPATEPTSAESRTRSRVGGSSSSSPAVTAAQMAPIASSASSISWLLDSSRGMASVRSANVLAPTASQVY